MYRIFKLQHALERATTLIFHRKFNTFILVTIASSHDITVNEFFCPYGASGLLYML